MKHISSILAGVTVLTLATGCTSYEIDMPENPEAPVVGNEVSTQVVYQANPRFFGETDCLVRLKAQLPRIVDMECDILWIMPVCAPGEEKSIGSPYCIRDFKSINPRYGTVDDLKSLVDDAHGRGMKVILDWIANHTSWDNSWIKEHPDWFVHNDRGEIVSPEGWSDVAQLDYNNPEVATAMEDAMKYWIDRTGIDGFRCDYVEGVPSVFWSKLIADISAERPEVIMLAESGNPVYYDDGFDMIYDWNCATAISKAFNGGKPSDVVSEASEALSAVPDGKSILRYVFNHDTAADNDVAKMYGSADALPAAYVAAAMLNGTPMIYSSMDVEGLSGKLSFFDYRDFSYSTRLTEIYKKINAAFKASGEVRRGTLVDYSDSSSICFTRSIPGHTLLVAVNTTADAKTVRVPINLAGDVMTDLIDGSAAAVPYVIELKPYGYSILMK